MGRAYAMMDSTMRFARVGARTDLVGSGAAAVTEDGLLNRPALPGAAVARAGVAALVP